MKLNTRALDKKIVQLAIWWEATFAISGHLQFKSEKIYIDRDDVEAYKIICEQFRREMQQHEADADQTSVSFVYHIITR